MINWLTPILQEHIGNNDTVLDLGCGIMHATKDLICKTIIGVDFWKQYLDNIKDNITVIRLDLSDKNDLSILYDKTFDIVLLLDIIEHLEKIEAITLIVNAERIARKKVIIFTPDGFLEQEDGKLWGENNPEYQKHRCSFTKEELIELGFDKIKMFLGDNIHNKVYDVIFAVKIL